MTCPATNRPCRTNGCGEKCYKINTLDLGYKTHPKFEEKTNNKWKLKTK